MFGLWLWQMLLHLTSALELAAICCMHFATLGGSISVDALQDNTGATPVPLDVIRTVLTHPSLVHPYLRPIAPHDDLATLIDVRTTQLVQSLLSAASQLDRDQHQAVAQYTLSYISRYVILFVLKSRQPH